MKFSEKYLLLPSSKKYINVFLKSPALIHLECYKNTIKGGIVFGLTKSLIQSLDYSLEVIACGSYNKNVNGHRRLKQLIERNLNRF